MSVGRWEFEHARRFQDEIGLIFEERAWSNGELHAYSRRFAAALLVLGVEPEDRVAIALGNCPELVIAYSGVVVAGAAVVVLGSELSAELVAKTVHCEPRVIVCVAHLAAALAAATPSATIVVVGTQTAANYLQFDDLISANEPLAQFVEVSDSTLIQLSYTSGSTGKPKAVPHTYGGLSRYLLAFAATLPDRDSSTTALMCAPPTAFASRLLALRVVANNRYVVLPRFDPERVFAAIERYRVQQLSILPTMAEQMVAYGARGSFDCSSLRWIHIGGAHVSAALVMALKKLGSNDSDGESTLRVAVQYGMTETGGGIAWTTDGGDGVVGRMVPGAVVRIQKSDGIDAPPGEVGEIIAKAPFAPDGYWRDREASASVFRNGFVHTGDLGYVRADGQLCLVGRSKDVIIQGGVNVHPSELTQVIYATPGVRECAVVGCANQVLGEEVVACVVRTPGAELGESQIRRQCRLALHPAKQPVRILFFDELPKKEGGKVDLPSLRREVAALAMRVPLSGEAAPGVLVSKAREIVECELRRILEDELWSAKPIGEFDPHVPLGELGLSSQGAVRLAQALQEQTRLAVPPTLAYSCPTIASCAEWLAALGSIQQSTTPRTAPMAQPSRAQSGAIVGMGVRLPGGVGTPEEFWDLLWTARETVGDAPGGRCTGANSRWRAAFLANVADFDAAFFRLSADAADIDPRHRQLLELCWEGLENAGIDPTALCGERTGVFLGLSAERYTTRNALGSAVGMAAGYLCQFFDIRGPVITVDTTCSSSLVALHHAMASLQRRECDLAIVGTANLLQESYAGDPLGVISGDGCTRAFDAGANGFGQGEGSLVLVLRRMEDALQAADRIYACVLGSAINHDGRSSSLTAPNPHSQARLIALALEAAGITPECVQYVEAHGTGTLLGDPIEVDGIVRSLGSGRSRPLTIGSVKANVGHLEAAAGLAGVAKVALALWQRQLPASRHCTTPNPRIPWADIPVQVQSSRGEWPAPDRKLIAGVSSFGMSGTNAHAVLAESPQNAAQIRAVSESGSCAAGRWLLPISARTGGALRTAVRRWIHALEGNERAATCRDIAYTASCRRAHLPFRIAVAGGSREEWAAGLCAHLANSGPLATQATRAPRKLALAFSGQGSQWNGMAAQLCAEEPVFRDTLERCSILIEARSGWSVVDELRRDPAESRLNATEVTQPVLFAVQVALYELWKSWGVAAVAAVGHSAGEVAAAYCCGLLTLEESVQVICERGRVCSETPAGAMLAAAVSPSEAEEVCVKLSGEIQIAAVNSPSSVVLSGSVHAVEAASRMLQARGVKVRALTGAHAFHSRRMQAAAVALSSAIVDPPSRQPSIRLISGMTAAPIEHLDADYWSRQLLERVRFCDAVHALLREGCTAFLEVGPHPVLLPAIHEVCEQYGCADALAVGSLRRRDGGVDRLLDSLGLLHCANVPVNWARRFEVRGRHVDLPGYPWEHRRYWHDSVSPRATALGSLSSALQDEPRAVSATSPATLLRKALSDLTGCPIDDLRERCSLHELGVDSLGRIQLRTQLAGWTGRPAAVPTPETTLGELLQAMAGAGISDRSERRTAPESSPLSWLRREGKEPIHVWIHPSGGGIDCYRPLAKDMPFRSIAIDSPALRAHGSAPASVEELAAEYLDHLERASANEPLVLGGWSFGGVIAFELAGLLARQGREVVEVILIDSFLGAALASNLPKAGVLPVNVPADFPACELAHLRQVQAAHLDALQQYRPRSYGGPVLSLRAVPAQGDPDALWRQVAPDLRIQQLRADHFSIMSKAATNVLLAALSGIRRQASPLPMSRAH